MPIGLPGGNVLNTQAFDLWTVRPTDLRFPLQPIDDFPGVPVLPETLLRMELMSHEFSVDLQEISQLVLSDLGATVQILRFAARECPDPEDRPSRIEDCISALGVQASIRAAGQKSVLSAARQPGAMEVWAHARKVAQACQSLASVMGTVPVEEAYLVGLTHALGSLPGLLGWPGRDRAASRLAECWSLPLCVQEFAAAWDRSDSDNLWVALVRSAHRQVRRSSLPCPFEEALGPRLQRL
jgi:hypothetical protein